MNPTMLTLARSSFVKDKPQYTIATICITYGIIGLVWHELKHRESLSLVKDLDWHTFLGGNITPIGASANVVAVGMLRKANYDVKFSDFVKIGLPFTLAAVSAAYIFLWFVWAR